MTNQEVLDALKAEFGAAVLEGSEPYGLLTITTVRERIVDMLTWLNTHPDFRVSFLTDLCGVHYPEQKGQELAVVYLAHSLENNFRIRIKVYLAIEDAVIPTLTGLYASANWMERETYDFFGIHFQGHPNLIRILNMEEMDYFPMRKEYTLEDPTRRDKVDKMFGR